MHSSDADTGSAALSEVEPSRWLMAAWIVFAASVAFGLVADLRFRGEQSFFGLFYCGCASIVLSPVELVCSLRYLRAMKGRRGFRGAARVRAYLAVTLPIAGAIVGLGMATIAALVFARMTVLR